MEHTQSHLCCIVFSQGYSSTTVLQSSHFQRRLTSDLGSALLFFIRVNVASTVVQTGACLLPPGRIKRKSVFLLFALSPFQSHERRKWNTFILGFPLLSTLRVSFLLLLFVEHTHTQTPGTMRPCSAVDIQKGPEWMAGICMHWLSACLPNISAQLMALLDTLI